MKKQNAILRKLVALRERGEYRRCIIETTRALRENEALSPTMKRSFLGLRSDCFLDAKKWREAVEDLTLLFSEKPDGAIAANRGLAFWYLGDLESAYKDYKAAVRLDPSDPVAHRNLGTLQIDRGRTRSGLWYIRRSIELSPGYPIGHVLLGDALTRTGAWVKATHAYLAALRLDPHNKRALAQIDKFKRYLKMI